MTSALLSFIAETHQYRLPDGRQVPSVTAILKAVGVAVDFEAIAESSDWLREAIALKRDIGTALHADAHAYDDDDLNVDTVDPRVAPYLGAWIQFRERTGVVPLVRERRVFHPGLFFCGTMDGIFGTRGGRQVLIDLKTGNPDDAGCAFQTAGYELAYRAEHPEAAVDERWAVQLCPERRVPYVVTNYSARPEAWRDGLKFQAFLTTYWEQAERRPRRA